MGSEPETPHDPRSAALRLLESRLAGPFLTLLGIGAVLWVNVGGYGVLTWPSTLAAELHSTPEEPLSWAQGAEAPYCYRWLFRALVLGACRVLGVSTSEGFYEVFVAASALSLGLAVFLLERFLRATGASVARARLGGLLFLASFPVLFAYDLPVHTREDPLAYALVSLQLWLVALERPLALALAGVVAANVRETTTLGLLPFVFVGSRPLSHRLAAVAPAFAAVALVHVLRAPPTAAHGYLLEGVTQNLREPTEALLYLGASLGSLWLLAGLRLAEKRASGELSGPWGWRASGLALGLAVLANALLGMLRECRIVFVAAPFAVKLSLEYLGSERFREVARARAAWLALAAVLVLGLALEVWIACDASAVERLRPWIGGSFQPGWAPPREMLLPSGETALVYPYWASPLNGVLVLLHLAFAAFVGAGEAARAKIRPWT